MEHLDAPLFQTLQTLPAFPFALLVRPDRSSVRSAEESFFTQRTPPSFAFSRADRFNCAAYIQSLDAVQDRIESLPALDIVKTLYREKILELRHRCALISATQQKDDTLVSIIADTLYGNPQQNAHALEVEFQSILSRAHELHTHRDLIDADAFKRMVEVALVHYGIEDWSVRLSTRPSISIIHANTKRSPIIKIPKSFSASRARAARVLTHEIETHALRTFNGTHSPLLLLGRGLAGYLATEEGLAIAMQQRLRDDATIDPGFWDAWAAALTQTYSFTDAFDRLCDARTQLNLAMHQENAREHAQHSAWRLLLRCMRGIHAPNRAGLGYRRDHLYRSGLVQVRAVLIEHGPAILPTLFAGHASIEHLSTLQTLGITGRVPDFIGKDIVKQIRKEMRQKNT